MNTPSINPIPSGEGSNPLTAEKVRGLIKKIEYNSRADEVYDTAATGAVKCSIGYAFVDHDYINEDSFDQQLLIKKCVNPFMVFPDSASIESDGSDQNHCTVLEKVKVRDYKAEFPDAEVSSFEGNDAGQAYGDDDEIIIAQFYERTYANEEVTAKNKAGADVKRTKKKYTVMRYKLNGSQILGRTKFPGKYVPVIPFYGEEAWNDGKRNVFSLIRKSKMSQYMLNLSESTKAEILMKQPIAPVMTPAGAIENYADDWKNPSKTMALRYDLVDAAGQPMPKPERLMPPQMSSGFANQTVDSINNIKATMGMYNNSIGQNGQEVSGKAIDARKIQGDVATYHFGDNAVRSITQIGRCIVCAMPEIYDTERLIDIIDEEDKPKQIGINGARAENQKDDYHLTKGDYDVRVITGSSFTTMRQESAAFYQDVVKTNPDMLKVCGDLMFQNMDVAGAQAMASRMKKLIPPELLEEDGQEKDPQVLALEKKLQEATQVINAGAQELQQLQQQVQDKNAALQAKANNDAEKNAIEKLRVQQEGTSAQIDGLVKLMTLQINSDKNDITEQKNAGDFAIKSKGQNTDVLVTIIQMLTDQVNAESAQQELPDDGDTLANNGGVIPEGNPTNV